LTTSVTTEPGSGLGRDLEAHVEQPLTASSSSKVGRGTSFTLRFPARDDRTVQAAAS
jgi:hypothetical protein